MPRKTPNSSARGMIPIVNYHSAHRAPHEASPVQRWEGSGCLAFTHDLMASPRLPPEFALCDVLIAEVPWQKGFATFNQRAGVDDERTYAGFLRRLSEIVDSVTTTPLYLVTGRHAVARLPKPDAKVEMMLNEWDALVLGYRPGPELEQCQSGVIPEFLHALAQRHDVAGDFACGYGRTARFFLRSGKRAVMSDFNPKCIGYIAEHAAEWAVR